MQHGPGVVHGHVTKETGAWRLETNALQPSSERWREYTAKKKAIFQPPSEKGLAWLREFAVVTANVNTLCPKEYSACRQPDLLSKGRKARATCRLGITTSGRSELLEKEFNEQNVAIVGIQEGRVQTDQVIDGKHYVMYVAGASKCGSHGCQIWVHRGLLAKALSVEVVSPRLVIVVLKWAAEARHRCGRPCSSVWQ